MPYSALATSDLLVVATHVFSFLSEKSMVGGWADAIEASARELISKLPEEIPEEE